MGNQKQLTHDPSVSRISVNITVKEWCISDEGRVQFLREFPEGKTVEPIDIKTITITDHKVENIVGPQ